MDNNQDIIIDLLRHGEVEGGPCFRGKTDDPLTTEGWQNMANVLDQTNHWQAVMSSPLKRCYEFAQHFAKKHSLSCQFDDRFSEMNFGDWDGVEVSEFSEIQKAQLKRFWNEPANNPPPNGESMTEFQERVKNAWIQLILQTDHQHILLITHAGTIRMILSLILQIPFNVINRIEIPYASMSRIRVSKDEDDRIYPSIIFHGKPC
ncbi:MAG: histidine phosphatase family protein [Methylococcales bacterium]|jgi:alpha-ribazole phosphatase|nr:histidine phosphatase family protein [Methylococcales bacterium]MBT7410291.1 histidine phosphatase family protein [Methylococcales bacterium]